MKGFASELSSLGKPVEDDELLWYLLHGLYKAEYNPLITSVNGNPGTYLDDFYEQLCSYDMRNGVEENGTFISSANLARHGADRDKRPRDCTPPRRCLISQRTRWETPRGRYDEHNSKFSLSMKPKFNRPVGERNHFWRLLLAGARRQLMARCRCQQQRGTCTQHNQTTLPQLTVRLSISPVWWKQRIRRIVWKEIFAWSEIK
jgi:hypothetical protein